MISNFTQRYGEWAVVTGASSGIGREIAIAAAQAGLKVALVARSTQPLSQLAQQLDGEALSLDLAQPEAPRRLLETLGQRSIGLLVNAAGFGSGGPFLQSKLSTELEMVDVNCRSVLALTHAFAQRFAAQRRGGIVLFSSIVGWQGAPNAANYAATKAYIQSLGEALAQELKPHNIDVLTAAPGPVQSGFAARAAMNLTNPEPAARIARDILDALGAKSNVVPGRTGKLLTAALSTAPRSLRVKIMQSIMRGMTQR
jgi:uncharacterized protein